MSDGQLEAVWLRERLRKLDFSAEFDARLRLVSSGIAGLRYRIELVSPALDCTFAVFQRVLDPENSSCLPWAREEVWAPLQYYHPEWEGSFPRT